MSCAGSQGSARRAVARTTNACSPSSAESTGAAYSRSATRRSTSSSSARQWRTSAGETRPNRLVASSTRSRHAFTPPPIRWLPISHVTVRRRRSRRACHQSPGASMGTDRAPSEVNTFARSLFADLPSRYDTLAYLLSFGQDRRWRAAVVERITAADPRRVLDVACVPLGVTLAIAHACNAEMVGIDLTEDMLRQGLRSVRAAGVDDRVKLAIAR